MVQPCGVDSFGYGAILLSDSRLRGPSGFGAGPVLEAWWMVSSLGSTGFVSGHCIYGTVPRQSSAAPGSTTRPLLWPVLCQICHSSSDCHGACAWTGSPFHTQKEKGLETIFLSMLDVSFTSQGL